MTNLAITSLFLSAEFLWGVTAGKKRLSKNIYKKGIGILILGLYFKGKNVQT